MPLYDVVSKQTVQNSVDCFLPQKNIWLSSIWRHSWMPTTISPKTILEDIRMPWGFSSQLIPGNSSKRLLCFYFRTSVAGLCLERERSNAKNITTDLFHCWGNALLTCSGNDVLLFRKNFFFLLCSGLLLTQATNPCTDLFCPLPHFLYELCANCKKDVLRWACGLQVTDTIPLERKKPSCSCT